ncbi:Uncharacterised protein [BD1-7 clade bacterium]|uniref:Uncharacterized protein n=1 Tax=BD1-7 clade bacterium TaxID=2029982 RepID=A0A5S9PIE2_9GAMM|nr:Uncharacterised protein [BD1-7 clade bacterium]CAA0103648.1 Uncharacterised protein [BD1-7 clade bacterium]
MKQHSLTVIALSVTFIIGWFCISMQNQQPTMSDTMIKQTPLLKRQQVDSSIQHRFTATKQSPARKYPY